MLYIHLEYLKSTHEPITGDLTLFKEHCVNAINLDIVQREVRVTRSGEVEGTLMEIRITGKRREGDAGAI